MPKGLRSPRTWLPKRALDLDQLIPRAEQSFQAMVSADLTWTDVNQPVRSISASAQASPLSLLIRRLLIASAARRASMQIIG